MGLKLNFNCSIEAGVCWFPLANSCATCDSATMLWTGQLKRHDVDYT